MNQKNLNNKLDRKRFNIKDNETPILKLSEELLIHISGGSDGIETNPSSRV